jgi:hypothetical protein
MILIKAHAPNNSACPTKAWLLYNPIYMPSGNAMPTAACLGRRPTHPPQKFYTSMIQQSRISLG